MAETKQERQQNELEALKAIFGVQLIESNDCCRTINGEKCWAPIDCILSLGPQQGSTGPQEAHSFIDLHIICCDTYPEKLLMGEGESGSAKTTIIPWFNSAGPVHGESIDHSAPHIILEKSKGLSSHELTVLQSELEKLAEEKIGEEAIYEIAQYTMNFLHQHNKPGFQSFYDEMVKRQQMQQKREIERKKAVEDKKRLEILLGIQNKQEAIKKEIKSRKISKIRFDEGDNIDEETVNDKCINNNLNNINSNLSSINDKTEKLSPVKKSMPLLLENGRESSPDPPVVAKNMKKVTEQKYGESDCEDFKIWDFSSKIGSRIESEFEVLDWVGKGAFGDVIKVRNRLDGCLYAIKRIELTSMNSQLYKKITREVKLLSRLNHENVVRYYNSWIESSAVESVTSDSSPVSIKSEQSKMVDMLPKKELSIDWNLSKTPENNDCSDDDDSSDDECWITFMSGYGGSSSSSEDDDDDDDNPAVKKGNDSDNRLSCVVGDIDTVDGKDKTMSPSTDEATTSNSTTSTIRQFMYIQMEYCEKSTLRSAIDEGLYNDDERVWRLLREIVEGLCHIHQQAIIHRDLKPVNIFIDSDDHVKIGDFGLATSNILHSTLKASGGGEPGLLVGLSSRIPQMTIDNATSHTGQVGTALYVAPELNTFGIKASYNQKVDIYSLGIIFFEMCYYPLNTGMERLKVLTELRQPECNFPSDFPENEKPQQAFLIRWLLNHDPSKRPSSQDLLQSDKIPPPQMEDSELQEMVRHTLSNPQSKAYKHLVAACFNQEVSTVQDITYDMSSNKSAFYLQLLETTIAQVKKVFKRHGAVSLLTPLLTPCHQQNLPDSIVRLMTRGGGVVTAPHNLRVPFARFLAQNSNVTQMKRYAIDRVYRERRVHGFHPRELYECAFDIVTPVTNAFEMVEAELLSIVWEVLNEFPVLLQKNCLIKLNHTSILKALLINCSIESNRHESVCSLLSKVKFQDGALSKSEIESFLLSNGLSEHNITSLLSFINVEFSFEKMLSFLKPVMKRDTVMRSLCREGLHNLEVIISYANTLGVKCPVVIAPGLVSDMHHYSGMMCQIVWDQRSKKGKIERNVIAAGGRYDSLISFFRQMLDSSKDYVHHHQCAAGISLSLDRLVSALQVDNKISSSPAVTNTAINYLSKGIVDAVVCSLGQNSRCTELLSVLHELWANNISCTVINSTQNLEEIQNICTEMRVSHIVILKDTDLGFVRVRSSLLKGRSTTTFQERRMQQNELVEHLQRLIKLQLTLTQDVYQSTSSSSASSGGGSTSSCCNFCCGAGSSSGGSKSDSKFTFSSESAAPRNINIVVCTLEKLTAAARRRYESQASNNIGNSVQKLAPKVRVEVLALALEADVIKMLASQIDLDSVDEDLTSVIKCFPHHKKYLNKINDQIQEIKSSCSNSTTSSNLPNASGSGRSTTPVLILCSVYDNYFKIIM